MKVIDFRVRPPYRSFNNDWFFGEQILNSYQKQSGRSIGESAKYRSMELFLQEMKESEIAHAVITGRSNFGKAYQDVGRVSNDDIVALIEQYPGTFSGVIGIDATNPSKAIEEIEQYVVKGVCSGITIETGFSGHPIRNDDESLYPIYQICEKNNIFIIFTAGNAYNRLWESDPVAMDNIAVEFPNLRMVLSHVGWPKIKQTIWIALKRENVWVLPDFYMFDSPGKDDFLYGLKNMVRDRMMFGSCYPLISFENALDKDLYCGIPDAVLQDYFYNNAAQFLGITM